MSPRPCCRSNDRTPARSRGCPRRDRGARRCSACAITSTPAAAGSQSSANDRDLVEAPCSSASTLNLERDQATAARDRRGVARKRLRPQRHAINIAGVLSRMSRSLPSPGAARVPAAVKGIIHVPAHNTPIEPPTRREALLMAIAKARDWVDDLAQRPGRQLRRDRPPGRQGRAAHPPAGAARLPLAADRIGTPRRHRAGRPHRHGACSRAALVLGRAGAAPRAAL